MLPDAGPTFGPRYAGKRVLFIGASGFLGGVTLSLLLREAPAVGAVHVLLRRLPGMTVADRFQQRVFPRAVFDPVRAAYGEDLAGWLAERLRVVQGDVSLPRLGMNDGDWAAVTRELDVIVNCSGLVDFHASLEMAYKVNVIGTQELIACARAAAAPLVHTSTCYVAGRQQGRTPESIEVGYFPRHAERPAARLDPEREAEDIRAAIASIQSLARTQAAEARFREQALERYRALNRADPGAAALATAARRAARDAIQAELVAEGRRRADFWGWPNVYTYSKSIAEQLLARSGVPCAVVRPTIIESAARYPFPGWNQNATTTAPMIYYVLESATEAVGRRDLVLDVVPVDHVAWGVLGAAATAMARPGQAVYQIGTSHRNPIDMGRIGELTSLYRQREQIADGQRAWWARLWSANRGASLIGAAAFRTRAAAVTAVTGLVADRAAGLRAATATPRLQRLLGRVEAAARRLGDQAGRAVELWDIFLPFSHELRYVFLTDRFQAMCRELDPGERDPLYPDPAAIDWRHYWLDVHIPGLRRWVFGEGFSAAAAPPRPAAVPLLDRVAGAARADPHSPALTAEGIALTYGQLWSRAAAAAALGAGDGPVLLPADAAAAWLPELLGMWLAGRTPAPAGSGRDVPAGRPWYELLGRVGAELGLAPGTRLAVLAPPGETELARLLLALPAWYAQAEVVIAAPGPGTEHALRGAPVILAGGAGEWQAWRAAHEDALAGLDVRGVLDLGPFTPWRDLAPFVAASVPVIQALAAADALGLVALRRVSVAEDLARPYRPLPPWQFQVPAEGPVLAAFGGDPGRPTPWRGRLAADGELALEASGGHRPLEPVADADAVVAYRRGDDREALLVVAPERFGTIAALKRYVGWRLRAHNADSPRPRRLEAIRVALAGDAEAAGQPVRWDAGALAASEPGPPEERLQEAQALLAGRFPAGALDLFLGHVRARPLTATRVDAAERVLLQALEHGSPPAQALIQAFDLEAGRWPWPARRQNDAPEGPPPPDELPPQRPWLARPLRLGLDVVREAFYTRVMDVEVRGRVHVPTRQNFIVIANHASHLDTGLIAHALGPWARRLRPLAAQDYFFDTPLKRFWAEQVANMLPVERRFVSLSWLKRVQQAAAEGDCVLLFPEGTRSPDGAMRPFKSSLGTLVVACKLDVLPCYVEGTHEALPKGRALPARRPLRVSIGPLVSYGYLERAAAGLGVVQRDRALTELLERAVRAVPAAGYFWLREAGQP